MKYQTRFLAIILAALLLLSGCSGEPKTSEQNAATTTGP